MELVLAVTGASGALAAELLIDKSPWPVALVASRWGKDICERECGSFSRLAEMADTVWDNDDLSAPIASGSVPTAGMVVLPCSCNAMAGVAGGFGDTLIGRAAHCHLKERRRLVLCVRESPWTLICIENARKATAAGAVVMPVSPPWYMFADKSPDDVTMADVMSAYVDRVLSLLGRSNDATWETMR